MDMTGEQLIALPQRKVWEALNDPDPDAAARIRRATDSGRTP